jgi:peptidoglycan/LPS O-acetylase OafA/YrhL
MGDPHQKMDPPAGSRKSGPPPAALSNGSLAGTDGPYRLDPAQPLETKARARVPELDALRGIACLAILIYHLKPSLVPFGWASVDLFFVLSGFLITSILIRHEGSDHFLRNFFVRRGLRIWPIYYLTVIAIVVLGPFLPARTSWDGLVYYLTYTQNLPLYWSDKAPAFSPYLGHLWTLANEEQFYIFWPLLVCVLGRRWVIPLALGLAGTSVAARGYGFNSWLLLARADGFALGGLLAALLANQSRVAERLGLYRRGFTIATLTALAFLVVVVSKGWLPTFGRPPKGAAFSVLAINLAFAGVVGLVATHAGRRSLAWLRRGWLVRVGVISYGLYMYHFVLLILGGDVMRAWKGHGSMLVDVGMLALSYLLAVLSWVWLEKPILGLKDRFGYEGRRAKRPGRAQTPAAAANPACR